MNTKILTAFAAAALLTGCSSLYKATATPDDIYYSPAPAAKTVTDAGYDRYENYQASNEDQYLRMKVRNNSLWGTIDDYSYWNNSQYDFGYSCDASRMMLYTSMYYPSFTNYAWGLYGGGFGYSRNWGSWYSPYQTVVLYKTPSAYFGSTNKANLTAYHNIQYSNTNSTKYFGGQGSQNGIYTTRGGNGNQNSGYTTRTTNGSYVPARSFSAGAASSSAGGRSGGFNSAGSSAGGSRAGRH